MEGEDRTVESGGLKYSHNNSYVVFFHNIYIQSKTTFALILHRKIKKVNVSRERFHYYFAPKYSLLYFHAQKIEKMIRIVF